MTLLLPTKACSLLPPSSSNTHDIYPIAYYPKITPSPYFSGPLLPVPNKKKNSVTFDVLDVIGVELVEESRIFFFNTKKTRWNKKRWTATTTKLGKPPPPQKKKYNKEKSESERERRRHQRKSTAAQNRESSSSSCLVEKKMKKKMK